MDDLRSVLESAVEEHAQPETPSAPVDVSPSPAAAPAETSSEVGGSANDVATPADSTTERGSPEKLKSIEEVAGVEPAAEKPADKAPTDPRIDRAPVSWKGESKKAWTELPLNVRQEVVRREREITKGLNEAAQARQQVSQVQEVLQPHMDRINSVYGGNAVQAINNLLTVERQLFNGTPADKAQLVANMINQFGIDLKTLDNLLSGNGGPTPEVQQQSSLERLLEQKLAPVQQFIQSQQQREFQQQQKMEQEAVHTLETMAQDERFPYFDDVRNDMADIIEMGARRGLAISLEQAYSRAVRMNDETYQAASVRDSSQAATNAALQAHQAAQRAKGAAVSVSGNPSAPSSTQFGNPSDLRGTILSALGETGSRL